MLDMVALCRKIVARSEEEKGAVLAVLDEFFVQAPAGWYHDRCEEELAKYRDVKTQASAAGKASAAARAERRRVAINGGPTEMEQELNGFPTDVERTLNGRSTDGQRNSNSAPTNQEPRTKNQEPITSTASSPSDDVKKCPIGQIVNLYHELMPFNPQVKVINEARKSAIRQRWREAAKLECDPFGYETRAEGLECWRKYFEICALSDFLTGKIAPQNGKPAFVADIDFLLSPSGFAKTLENKYHREIA